MTQFTLANRLGVSVSTVQQLEGDNKDPRLSTLLKVTRELGPFEVPEGGKIIRFQVKGNAQ